MDPLLVPRPPDRSSPYTRNLPEGWEKAGPLLYVYTIGKCINSSMRFRFLYILYLAVDVNFKLKGKDPNLSDVELMPGQGVFVEESQYQAHLKHHVDQPEVRYTYPSVGILLTIHPDQYL